MDDISIDLSDEEYVAPDDQLTFSLNLPSVAKSAAAVQGNHKGAVAGEESAADGTTAPRQTSRPAFSRFAYKGTSRGDSAQQPAKKQAINLVSPPSSDKPIAHKRRAANAKLFDESDAEDDNSDLDQPIAKRLRTLPVASEQEEEGEWQEVPELHHMQRQRRMYVKADNTTGDEQDVMQQFEEAGEELQEDQIDAVLERCEQLSLKLRQALQSQGNDRYSASDTPASALISHADLVAACGEAAKYFKPYQMVGVNFLLLLKRQGIRGSILADEMGLGKTAQAICFLGALRHLDQDSGPHLVVAPASLLENWQREFRRWCPGLSLMTYYGKDRASLRRQLLDARRTGTSTALSPEVISIPDSDASNSDSDSGSEFAASDSALSQAEANPHQDTAAQSQPNHQNESQLPFNVMLTCYTLFERDSAEQQADRSFLKKWQWSHLLLDEAHAVKNASAMRTKRLTSVAQHCKRRIMLTGTPLQNDLEELQNLLQFLLPDVFSKDEFSQSEDLQEDGAVERLTERMKAVLGPFVLRRLKSEVASQLTAKQHHEELVNMTPEQAALYQKAVSQLRAEVTANSKGKKQKKTGADGQAFVKQLGKQRVAHLFTHLRKIAQHPLLTRSLFTDAQVERLVTIAHNRQVFGGGCGKERISDELSGYSDHRLHDFALQHGLSKFVLSDEAVMSSGKCQLLVELLEDLQKKGSRPLIFSQWTSVLDILGWLLEIMGLTYVRLDGSTLVADRLATVDLFNDPSKGVFAFLLSTRAGGQGLNLTGADTVILHDVDFNPQIDRQAEDRCHRLGQTKPVHVYRLVTQSTVDEGIHALAKRKLKLDAAVLEGITAGSQSKQNTAATDAVQMGQLLQSLIAGSGPTEVLQENEHANSVIAIE